MLIAVPVKQKQAKAFIEQYHRHHKKGSVGDIFRIGIATSDDPKNIIGVAQIGRPVAGALDDDETVEVTRVCVKGKVKNACSFMYGKAARIAKELGYKKIITYTLPCEGGASLKAVGWADLGKAGGGSWNRDNRPRQENLFPQVIKNKYMKILNE